jgi:hypothetical protein
LQFKAWFNGTRGTLGRSGLARGGSWRPRSGGRACLGFPQQFQRSILDRFAQLGRGGDAACISRHAGLERRLRGRSVRASAGPMTGTRKTPAAPLASKEATCLCVALSQW